MNPEDIRRLEELALNATSGEWWWLATPTKTVNAAVRWAAHTIRKSDKPTIWGVAVGKAENHHLIAFTGNGDDSGVNSAYLVAVQPKNILLLISQIRRLEAQLALLSRGE